jgi:hypothetical protein
MSGIMTMLVGAKTPPTARGAALPGSPYVYRSGASGTLTASFSVNSAGTYTSASDDSRPNGIWLTGTGTGTNYEIRATVVSGSPTGTTGSWLALSSNRTWSVSVDGTSGLTETAELTLEIRDASTLTVYTTSSLTLEAASVI